jgi:catechol 2,3-dioxygenase-like lactoylglutathione lyase family enzyme
MLTRKHTRRVVMRILPFTVAACVLMTRPGGAAAQTQTPPTLPFDHVHLAAPDPAKAVEWYQKMFGGEPTSEGKDRLMFGKTRFIWLKSDGAKPSEGTTIDHIGFSFPVAYTKMQELTAAGVKIKEPLRQEGGMSFAFVEDPWGVKIEILQDPDQRGFHHVHLVTKDTQATLAWYQARFGGVRNKLNQVNALKYGDVSLIVRQRPNAPDATGGRAVDHIGWRVRDLDESLAALKGIKLLQGPTELQLATGKVHYSFVEDPFGTKIELVQR